MKFFSTTVALAACLPFALANRKGFNIAAQNPDGSCKQESDWQKSFAEMKKIGDFNEVRVYASSDCNTLEHAVPAAKREGIKILAGVWATPAAHYDAEKKALLKAVHAHGTSWISAISVGSEDLYRNDTDASALAGQVKDVRGMMTTVKGGRGIPIGHVDTWTEWANDATAPLIKAVDFVGMDGYPYYQNADIHNSKDVFYKSLAATQRAANKHKKGTPVWITESGWPSTGPNSGKAVASVKNAHHYWHHTLCDLFKNHTTFAYTLRDYYVAPADPSFGVVNADWKPIFDLDC